MFKNFSQSHVGLLFIASVYLILAGCSSSDDGGSDIQLAGIVSDPFISGARVWCDGNANGHFDETDKSVLSDEKGAFKFSGNDCAKETIVVDGLTSTTHVDVDGNIISKFTGRMKAPSGSKFVTPLTSLQQTLIDSGETASAARDKVAKALGLVDSTGAALDVDFGKLDINASDQKVAQKAAIVAQQLLLDTTAAMQGVSGAPMTPSSFDAVTKALASAISTATQPLIDANGGLDPVVVKQAVQSTVEAVVKDESSYSDFDSSSIMLAIGDAVVVNSQQAATIVDESGTEPVTAAKLTQSQGSGSEMIRVTMDSIKSYVDGSGDFDGDGEADIGQGSVKAAAVFSELADVLAAVSSGLADAVSTDANNATTNASLSAEAKSALIANVIQQTVGMALEDKGLGSIAARIVDNVDTAMTNGDTSALSDSVTNNAPVAIDRTLTLRKGTTKTAKLRGKDFDEGDSLTFVITDATGKATLGTDGEFTYDATALTAGTYTFTFTVTDDASTPASDSGTVKVTVLGANLAPIASDLSLDVRAGEAVKGRFPVVNLDGDTLTFSLIGSIGSIVNGNQYSIDTTNLAAGLHTITYLVNDGNGGKDTGLITLEILGLSANNPPTAFNGALKITAGAKKDGQFRASDPDVNTTLTYSNVDSDARITSLTPGTGAFEFDATNLTAGVYRARFSVSDGTSSDTGVVVVTVIPTGATENTPPLARDSRLKLLAGATATGTLSGFDLEGDALTFVKTSDPGQGTVTVGTDGTFSFNATNAKAGIYEFNFSVTASGASDTGTVTVLVMATNTAPVAYDLSHEVDKATAGSSYSSAFIAQDDGNTTALVYTITNDAGGRAALTGAGASDGSFTFNLSNTDPGLYQVMFNAYDGEFFGSGTVNITVKDGNVSNNSPTALDGEMVVMAGTTGSGTLTAFDEDGDTLIYVITGGDAAGAAVLTSTGSADGTFTFDATNISAGVKVVNFRVTDPGEATSTGTMTVTVRAAIGANNPPMAENGQLQMNAGEIKTGRFVATDRDNNALTYSITSQGGLSVTLVDASTGEFSVDATGVRGVKTIAFSVTDGTASATGSVEVTVLAVNSVPVATNSTLQVTAGETKAGILQGTDEDGSDTLTFMITENPSAGTVSLTGANYTYNATGVSAGTYSFTFSISDGDDSSTGTVAITVIAANNPPTASNGTLSVTTGETGSGTLSGNDLDGGDTLTFSWKSGLSADLVTVNSNGSYTVSTTGLALGTHTFMFDVSDGSATASATITVTVIAIANNAPVAQDQTVSGLSGGAISGTVLGTDSDSGDTLVYSMSDTANFEMTSGSSGAFTFNATLVADGTYTATFTVTDSKGASDEGTITVVVGSFLEVSAIVLNGSTSTVDNFESNGATVPVPVTTFGLNLEALGNVPANMTVELGLVLDGTAINKGKVTVVVDAVDLKRVSGGGLTVNLPDDATATVVYLDDENVETSVDVVNAGADMVTTTPAGKAITLSLNLSTLLNRLDASGSLGGIYDGSVSNPTVTGTFAITAVVDVRSDDNSANMVTVKVKDGSDLTTGTTITADEAAVTGQSVSGNVMVTGS